MKEHPKASSVMPKKHLALYRSFIGELKAIEEAFVIANIDLHNPPKRQAVLLEKSKSKVEAIEALYELYPF